MGFTLTSSHRKYIGYAFLIIFIVLIVPVKNYLTPKKLKRDHSRFLDTMEVAPVEYKGEMIIVTFERGADKSGVAESFGRKIVIYDNKNYNKIAEVPWDKGLGSAIVEDGKLFVFGSSDWSKYNNCIYKVQLELSGEPRIIQEDTVFCAGKNKRIFNSSVAKAKNGFVIAYEEDENKTNVFYTAFLKSESLLDFENLNINFRKGTYTACPTIRYSNGYYHLFFLDRTQFEDGSKRYTTKMSFAKELQSLSEDDLTVVLDPKFGLSNNNSDFDLVEYDGSTYLFYAESDQQTWAKVYTAIFNDSEEQFLKFLRESEALEVNNREH